MNNLGHSQNGGVNVDRDEELPLLLISRRSTGELAVTHLAETSRHYFMIKDSEPLPYDRVLAVGEYEGFQSIYGKSSITGKDYVHVPLSGGLGLVLGL